MAFVTILGGSLHIYAQTEPVITIETSVTPTIPTGSYKARNVKIVDATNTTLSVRWDAGYSRADDVVYEVSYTNSNKTSTGTVKTSRNSITLTDLWEGEYYIIQVGVRVGDSDVAWSNKVSGTTHFRNTQVQNVRLRLRDQRFIEIAWDELDISGYYGSENDSPLGYHIEWKKRNESWNKIRNTNHDYINETQYEIVNLQPNTAYDIRVRMYRKGTYGAYGDWSRSLRTSTLGSFFDITPEQLTPFISPQQTPRIDNPVPVVPKQRRGLLPALFLQRND